MHSQDVERAKVKARIKALAEKTVSNGCTEAEAMSAAEMVGRLLEQYALSMDEIDIREERCLQVAIPYGGKRVRPIAYCLPAIARFCDCKFWTHSEEHTYVFYGLEPDTELAQYLFHVVEASMRSGLADFKNNHPELSGTDLRSASRSFQLGMADRLGERLDAMLRKREASVAAKASTGTALVVAKRRIVDDAFANTGIKLVSAGGGGGYYGDKGAFHSGREAGNGVNLNRPVNGSGRALLA